LGFSQVPRAVLRARQLSDKAKIVYALLLDYAWQEGSCFPGQGRLAQDLHTTERTVRRCLSELKAYHLVDWKQRGLNQTNVYYILPLAGNPNLDLGAPERTKMSGPDRTPVSGQKRTKTSDIIDSEIIETELIDTDISSKGMISNLKNLSASRFSKKESLNQQNPSLADAEPREKHPRKGGLQSIGELISHRQAVAFAQLDTVSESRPTSERPKRGRRARTSAATAWIRSDIERYSGELHDPEHVAQNTGQAARLYQASGLSEAAFCQLMGEARSITKQYNIKKRAQGQAGEYGLRNKMPYFFKVLRDLLGMKQQPGVQLSQARGDWGQEGR
jgi:hypothetical protein